MADLAPGALRQGLRHAAGSIGAAVQATSGAAAAAARLNLLYEGYSGKEIEGVFTACDSFAFGGVWRRRSCCLGAFF